MRWGTLHAGIDLAAPMRTPEMAAMDGVVLKAGPASGFGLAVYIQHANGDVTVYGHMDQILVPDGQVVKAGDVIALLGNRGQATGPHLHFEVHVGGINGHKTTRSRGCGSAASRSELESPHYRRPLPDVRQGGRAVRDTSRGGSGGRRGWDTARPHPGDRRRRAPRPSGRRPGADR